MNHLFTRLAAALLVCAAAAPGAFAQGGGASQTGTIVGRVTDTSGGVLPGVTVTIASPSLMGVQTATTNENGTYRFPAVPPGVYTVAYDLAGFSTLRRERIDIALGFTATVNVELAVATLQETVTVTGESPVIDTSATRVQQNFKLDQLESIPNARDMWSLLAVTPSVQMTRIDVGGNRAGTQTGFTAFGFGNADQQVRVLVEGINTTEGTGGAGFYFDFGSFEEAFFGTAAQGAEMPHPGVQTQFLGKSGGPRFSGQVYADYENNSMQGANISAEQIARGVREGSNEVEVVRDANVHVGGPLVRDKVWGFGSWREQFNAVRLVAFAFDQTFDTTLWNLSGKVSYQMNQNNKFIGYYQWGQKVQPNRTGLGGFTYLSPEDTTKQDSGSWVWKGEPHVPRHSDEPARPRDARLHERAGDRPLQDAGAVDEQAHEPAVVGAGGVLVHVDEGARRRRRVHVSRQQRVAEHLPQLAQRHVAECVHVVERQGGRELRRAVGRPGEPGAPAPGRPELRPHDHLLGAGGRVLLRAQHQHGARGADGHAPVGQHHGVRRAGGKDRAARPDARKAVPGPVQSDEQQRRRDDQLFDGRGLRAADGHPGAARGAGGLPVRVVRAV